jgi:hypothetical protein
MHPYASDESRVPVYAWLGVAAVIGAWLISLGASRTPIPQWLISAPSLAAVYALLYKWFDEKLWRRPWLRHLRLALPPDVEGRYSGTITSTYKDEAGAPIERGITLIIQQSWTRVSVEMQVTAGTSTSTSTSAVASVSRDGSVACLSYLYRNRTNPGLADSDMGDHEGAAVVRLYPDGRMAGRYFNSRPRAGTIEVSRIQRAL